MLLLAALPPADSVPQPLPARTAVCRTAERTISRREETDVLDGLVLNLVLDSGRIVCHVIQDKIGYIEAEWPHNGNAMVLAISRLKAYGWQPIPEQESPAEFMPNGRVRIYLEEFV